MSLQCQRSADRNGRERMSGWECEASIVTRASRSNAWAFWTDMDNHVKMEDGVKAIELDGPFVSGMTGRTLTAVSQQEWELKDVVEERHFAIVGVTPDGRGSLSFAWTFEDEGQGTRITYRIRAHGPEVDRHVDVFGALEERAPLGIAAVGAKLDRLSQTGAFDWEER